MKGEEKIKSLNFNPTRFLRFKSPNSLLIPFLSVLFPKKIQKYNEIKNDIFRLMKEADEITESIREKIREKRRKISF